MRFRLFLNIVWSDREFVSTPRGGARGRGHCAARRRAPAQKRGFAFFENCFNVSAILHSTFYIQSEILRRFAPPDDRRGSNTNARLCHPELVVARVCCQHFADGKMLDLQGGSSSFPKISLRCDFREPCFSAQSNGSLKIIPSLSFRPRRAESPPSGEILYRIDTHSERGKRR